MTENRKLVRPPFDSDGNVVWTTEEKPMKKKALQWWVWLIPAGLICVIVLGVFLYRSANRKTPEELCRDALRDAFEEALGYREPMMKAMHTEDLAGYLKKTPTDVGLALQIQNTNLTLADFGFGERDEEGNIKDPDNSPKLLDYRGMGLAFITTYDGDAVSLDTRFAVSALSLSVAQLRYADGELRFASPKIINEVISVPLKDVKDQWKDAPVWALLSEDTRKAAQNLGEAGFAYGAQGFAIAKNVRDAIVSSYPGGDSAWDRMVDAVSYEQLKDENGKELTERVVVGSEKVPCYVFDLKVDEKTFYDIAERIGTAIGGQGTAEAVRNAFRLTPDADGGNGVKVLAYVTKEGELAQLTAEVNGTVGEKQAHFSAKLRCMGTEDPQDKLFLTLNGDVGGEVYELSAKKTVTADRSRVSTDFDISLRVPGMEQVGLNGRATYNIGGGILKVYANATVMGKTVAALDLSAECTYKNSWDMRINDLTITNRTNDKFLTLYGQFSVSQSKSGVMELTGDIVPLLTMTEEQAKAIVQEATDQINWYIRQFFR